MLNSSDEESSILDPEYLQKWKGEETDKENEDEVSWTAPPPSPSGSCSSSSSSVQQNSQGSVLQVFR